MLGIIGSAILILGLTIVVWHNLRARRATSRPADRRPIVTPEDARAAPYPYVFVSDRGSVRELHATERDLLETPFHALDAARPYVKTSFAQKNDRGGLSGYCRRSEIPRRMPIGYPPIERPTHPRWEQPRIN